MSLLAPLFLLGAMAVALPVWLHRLQAQSSERKAFSSVMLLETARQQVHVRKKFKFLVLLTLRSAFIFLLAFAFAKPFMTVAPDAIVPTTAGTRLVLVDTSVSMGRAGVFAQARTEARRAIDDAPGGALLQVLAADNTLLIASELSSDKSVLYSAIEGLSISAQRLNFGNVMRGVERFVTSLPAPVTVHFVSDFQASAMPTRFSDLIPAGVSGLTPHVVGTGAPFNWSVNFVRETAEGIDVGVTGAGDRERIADIDLRLNGEIVASRGLIQTGPHVVAFDIPAYESGTNRIEIRINTDDDLQVDNSWFHVLDNEPPAAIPLITLNSGGLPVIYLSAALESAGAYQVEPLIAGNFDARVLDRYRWLVIDDIGLVGRQLELSLAAFLENGGNVLAFAGERAASLETLPLSGHRHKVTRVANQAGEFMSIGQIDTQHPALAKTEGWHSVHVSRSMPLEPLDGDEVLIRLENGEPFLIERRMGAGRLLLLSANLDNRWNDLPVRPVFVSFIVEAARYLSGVNQMAKSYTTGATLPLTVTGNTSGQVIDPDGNTVLSLADTTREQQVRLNKPGFYQVYTPRGETVIAANIDPLESDLRKISQELLDRWRDATDGQAPAGDVTLNIDDTNSIEAWHWVLLVLTVVVIGESILGNFYLTAKVMPE
jgi:aerotolerance regulator-like protein